MIKIEKTEVVGFEAAVRGMRNPMNSWENSDSHYCNEYLLCQDCPLTNHDYQMCDNYDYVTPTKNPYVLGPNDYELMKKLVDRGPVHAKFRRMIVVYADITAPLYWWKEYDTYKVGTVANSCSTMHKIHAKEFTFDDFSYEHLYSEGEALLGELIDELNASRTLYMSSKKKHDWWQLIQLLPTCYNQKRTVMINYEVLSNIYHSRFGHKLDEWNDFCCWIQDLPYSSIITRRQRDDEK